MGSRPPLFLMLAIVLSLALASTVGIGQPLSPERQAADVLAASGVAGGLIVHVGCGDGRVTAALRAGDAYVVHGLDRDPDNVVKARARISSRGLYGPVSVDRWAGDRLPYVDNLVTLAVVENAQGVSMDEIMRVLAPHGVAYTRQGAMWTKTVKPWPAEMDQWTHYLHGPDGNPVANDSLVGPPTRLQWVGNPRWARHHDHMASMTSLVSARGRLFYIFDEGPTASIQLPDQWRLIARDAFNGTILWKRTIDRWNTRQYPLKSGPAHLLRRLVAVDDRVYVTLGIDAPLTALDAATGRTVRTYADSEYTREIIVAGTTILLVADTSPSRLPDYRRTSTYVWDNSRHANPNWGWHGDARKVLAYDAHSGQRLWEIESPVAPCSLAADTIHAVFHDGEKLVCLDRSNGNTRWRGESAPTSIPVHTNTGPRVLIYRDVVLLATNDGKMSGWSLDDGRKLWQGKHQPSGHQSLKDLFVTDGLVWTAAIAAKSNDGVFFGYDPFTGEKKREFPPDVFIHWFHHRCYPCKATGKYILAARNGTEYIDLDTERWKPNHWVRGGCIYGVMPCNGMTYASMHSCGCQLEAKLMGFNALTAGAVPQPSPAELSGNARLERGPAYGLADGSAAGPGDWPTYRHDEGRSGATPMALSPVLNQVWQTGLGGRLSAPTSAAGKLFVASVDAHSVHALDARTGRRAWTYTAGGRVDSPPTYYRGLILFGSADGYVYALGAEDGTLAWRFRGAPVDERMMAWEQLESAWPVHGSVLVHDGVLYCTAGRNMYLEGGIHFLRLDPVTGRLLGETVMDDIDPVSGEDMQLTYLKKTQGNNMPVALSDVLSCDGRHIWMRSQKIDFEGQRHEIALENVEAQTPEDFHLFCQVGLLDDSYFFRSYWNYGRRVTGGYGGWFKAGRLIPAGRILCFDGARVYGFGRKPEFMVNASVLEYQLFAADKAVTEEAINHIGKANKEINARSEKKNANASDWKLRHFFPTEDLTAARFTWTLDQPAVIARAMAVAGETLFVAGPPDFIDERQAFYHPDDPDVQARLARQAEALTGQHGGQIWAMSATSGAVLRRYALDTIPTFDGMAAAQGRLFITTVDGRILCLSAGGTRPLVSIEDTPLRVAWDQPEDPNYLVPVR